MSFTKYPPNPTLQRLRQSMNGDGLKDIFKPTLAVEHYVPLCVETTQDNYEQHTISDYGDLTDLKSFAIKTHGTKHLRKRRKSSATGSLASATPRNGQQFNQVPSIELNILEESAKQATETEDAPKSSSSTIPPTSTDASNSCPEALTGRPVAVPQDDEAEDPEDAVILQATRVKLCTQKPQRFTRQQSLTRHHSES